MDYGSESESERAAQKEAKNDPPYKFLPDDDDCGEKLLNSKTFFTTFKVTKRSKGRLTTNHSNPRIKQAPTGYLLKYKALVGDGRGSSLLIKFDFLNRGTPNQKRLW